MYILKKSNVCKSIYMRKRFILIRIDTLANKKQFKETQKLIPFILFKYVTIIQRYMTKITCN